MIRKKTILCVFLLILSFSVGYFLKPTTTANQKSNIKDADTQNGTIIEAKTGSFNSNGKINTIQLQLSKNGKQRSSMQDAKLILIEEEKEIYSKNVTLETGFEELELVNLFDYNHQQILLTVGVGAHSLNGFFYQLKDNALVPICPDDSEGGPNSCYFFSDGARIYAEDLDGDGVKEIISANFTYYGDPVAKPTVYKWNGSIYKTVTGTQYDKFMAVLKAKNN